MLYLVEAIYAFYWEPFSIVNSHYVCIFHLQIAILNANYMVARLKDHYKILFTGSQGWIKINHHPG